MLLLLLFQIARQVVELMVAGWRFFPLYMAVSGRNRKLRSIRVRRPDSVCFSFFFLVCIFVGLVWDGFTVEMAIPRGKLLCGAVSGN